jgi:hypothetical protein
MEITAKEVDQAGIKLQPKLLAAQSQFFRQPGIEQRLPTLPARAAARQQTLATKCCFEFIARVILSGFISFYLKNTLPLIPTPAKRP